MWHSIRSMVTIPCSALPVHPYSGEDRTICILSSLYCHLSSCYCLFNDDFLAVRGNMSTYPCNPTMCQSTNKHASVTITRLPGFTLGSWTLCQDCHAAPCK